MCHRATPGRTEGVGSVTIALDSCVCRWHRRVTALKTSLSPSLSSCHPLSGHREWAHFGMLEFGGPSQLVQLPLRSGRKALRLRLWSCEGLQGRCCVEPAESPGEGHWHGRQARQRPLSPARKRAEGLRAAPPSLSPPRTAPDPGLPAHLLPTCT